MDLRWCQSMRVPIDDLAQSTRSVPEQPSQVRARNLHLLLIAGAVTIALFGTASMVYYLSRRRIRSMSNSSLTPRDRYLSVIDKILQTTPPDQFLSTEQVLELLEPAHRIGYPELFERCMAECTQKVMAQAVDSNETAINHQLEVLKTIQQLWQQGPNPAADAIQQSLSTEPTDEASRDPFPPITEDDIQKELQEPSAYLEPPETDAVSPPDDPQPHEHYAQLIEDLLSRYLNGEFLSKEAVQNAVASAWRQLETNISADGQYLEQCLAERQQDFQNQVQAGPASAKIERSHRGIKMLQQAWEQLAVKTKTNAAITSATDKILAAQDSSQILLVLVQELDLNRTPIFSNSQLELLIVALKQRSQNRSLTDANDLKQLAAGLEKGLTACHRLQSHVTGWIFDAPVREAGFQQSKTPWEFWARKLDTTPTQTSGAFFQAEPSRPSPRRSLPQTFFTALAQQHLSVREWVVQSASRYQLSDWVELVLVMRFLQRGLVTWFDQQAYDTTVGPKFSISSYLTFASLWSELAVGARQVAEHDTFANAYFQITLQILRSFAQQPYFPLYGGVFASFSGGSLNMTLEYLDTPLKKVEGTQEKARILTLLGYSQRALGHHQQAISFHQQALDIARAAQDWACEIANLNHLSRSHLSLKEFSQAIDYSQRALILSRQQGDRRGEANSLANLGFSQVCASQQVEQAEPDSYVIPMQYLQQGLEISEKLQDLQSQALCHSSLGIAHLTLSQPPAAIAALEAGLEAAIMSGDSYLKGLNCSNLAEAFHQIDQPLASVYHGCLGMYVLKQIGSPDWSQAAGLLRVIQGRIGADAFQEMLQQKRSQIIREIGVDGYDYIPELLAQY